MDDDTFWVGLDLGLTRTSVCIMNGQGFPLNEFECDSEVATLTEALAAVAIDRIGGIAVEAGTGTYIVRKLRGAGFPVVVFEARKAHKFLALRRNKSDASDARGLADLVRIGQNSVSQVHLKTDECQRLRSFLVVRQRFVLMKLAVEGVLRCNFALHGRRLESSHTRKALLRRTETIFASLRSEEGIDLEPDLAPLVMVCDSVRAYLEKSDRDLQAIASSHPVCRLLMEVPGVGPICALSFYSAIGDPNRFRVASHVGAYLGLVPRRYQSGAVSRTLGITKNGNRLTRSHLVMAAAVFARRAPDCPLKDWYLALRGRAGPKRARIALARKLAVILLAMWKQGTHFELDRTGPSGVLSERGPTETVPVAPVGGDWRRQSGTETVTSRSHLRQGSGDNTPGA